MKATKSIVFRVLFNFQWWYSYKFAGTNMLPIPIKWIRSSLKRLFEWSRIP